MPVSSYSWIQAFSLNKQADAGTAVADAKVNKLRSTQGYNPSMLSNDVILTDADWHGKGHSWPTFRSIERKHYVLPSQQRPCSDLDLLWCLGYVMGADAPTQPDALGKPTQWQHVITFQPLATQPEVKYTSLLEQFGDGSSPGLKRKLIGAWLETVNLQIQLGQFINLNFQGAYRESAVSAATLPATVTAAHLFNAARTTLSFGPDPAPDISAKWAAINLTFTQTPDAKLRAGASAGEETLVQRADVGNQRVTGSILLEFEDTFRDYFHDQDELEATITLNSLDEVEGDPASCAITIPVIYAAGEGHSEEGRTSMIELTLDESGILKGAGDYVSATFITDINATDMLVTNP